MKEKSSSHYYRTEEDVVDFECDEQTPSASASTMRNFSSSRETRSREDERQSRNEGRQSREEHQSREGRQSRKNQSREEERRSSSRERRRSPPRHEEKRPERSPPRYEEGGRIARSEHREGRKSPSVSRHREEKRREDRRSNQSPSRYRDDKRLNIPTNSLHRHRNLPHSPPRARSPLPHKDKSPLRKRPRSPSPSRRNENTRRKISNSPPRINFRRASPRPEYFLDGAQDARQIIVRPEDVERIAVEVPSESRRYREPERIRMPLRDESPLPPMRQGREDTEYRNNRGRSPVIRRVLERPSGQESDHYKRSVVSVHHDVKPTSLSTFDLSLGGAKFTEALVGNGENRFFVARCNYYDIFVKAKRAHMWKAPEYVVDRIRKAAASADKLSVLILLALAMVDSNRPIEYPNASERLARVPLTWLYIVDVPFYQVHHINGLFDRQGDVKESFEINPDHSGKMLILFEKFSRRMILGSGAEGDIEENTDAKEQDDSHNPLREDAEKQENVQDSPGENTKDNQDISEKDSGCFVRDANFEPHTTEN